MANMWLDGAMYCADVETYADSNQDGVGDFSGMTARLDYLAGLGITCLRLLPFYATPNRDDGYDVSDHSDVDPRLGSREDARRLLTEAGRRGIRVIGEWIIGHTSDEHPWFQEAREDPPSPYRDFYVWSDLPRPATSSETSADLENSNWSHDRLSGRWYRHRRYHFEPELRLANPQVRLRLAEAARAWLDAGLSGFHVDLTGLGVEDAAAVRGYVREVRQAGGINGGVLVGDTDVPRGELAAYFGGGAEFDLLLNVPLNRALLLSLARGDARPLKRILSELPEPPDGCAWVNFVGSHDDLDLSRMDDDIRAELLEAFAHEERDRPGGRAIRRRATSLLGERPDRLEMVYSLLFSLPGLPMLVYGDEIGLRENPELPERLALRPLMQWSAGRNGGFSDAEPGRLVRPAVTRRTVGFGQLNVATQEKDTRSLLNRIRDLLAARRGYAGVGSGRLRLLESGDDAVLAHAVQCDTLEFVAVHNLSGQQRIAHIRDDEHDPGIRVRLEPYGYGWLANRPQDTGDQPAPTAEGQQERPTE